MNLIDRFRRFGYGPETNWPPCAKTFSGSLLIVGSARCVWGDLNYKHAGDVMCVNDVGMHYPGQFQHWYSNHSDNFPHWLHIRQERYKPHEYYDPMFHSCFDFRKANYWPWPGHGTSGLNAVYTGIALGYEKIILAGIPLDDSGHYFDPPNGHSLRPERKWTTFTQEVPGDEPRFWRDAKEDIFQGAVRSLSGRTLELLGGPAD